MEDKQPLFVVIFKDDTKFIGGYSYFESKWMEIPFKPIKRIFYKIPTGDYICLSGYDQYFHMVEATKDWMRIGKTIQKLNNKPTVEYAYIMGKKGEKITSYRITLIGYNRKDKRYKIGDITQRNFNINDEFIKKLNSDIWR